MHENDFGRFFVAAGLGGAESLIGRAALRDDFAAHTRNPAACVVIGSTLIHVVYSALYLFRSTTPTKGRLR